MNRSMQLQGSIECIELAPRSWGIEVALNNSDIGDLCIELLLARFALVEAVTVTQASQPLKMVFILLRDGTRSRVSHVADRVDIALDVNTADFIIVFLLRYFRDGVTSVNHIDIELEYPDNPGTTFDFVLRTNRYAAPMSADEARKLLGVDDERGASLLP